MAESSKEVINPLKKMVLDYKNDLLAKAEKKKDFPTAMMILGYAVFFSSEFVPQSSELKKLWDEVGSKSLEVATKIYAQNSQDIKKQLEEMKNDDARRKSKDAGREDNSETKGKEV